MQTENNDIIFAKKLKNVEKFWAEYPNCQVFYDSCLRVLILRSQCTVYFINLDNLKKSLKINLKFR